MERTILLVTTRVETERRVMDCIPLSCSLICVTAGELMVRLYEMSPEVLLVDLDNLSEQTLDMVHSTVSLMYIPIIYLYSEEPLVVREVLKGEVILKMDRVNSELNNLLKQAAGFKKKYDEISESYDAIDMLSGNIKGLLDKNMSKES
ncbi:MAG: hypothetical protein Q8930_05395, partial [Bacillota bacterium]|nr:hypothetical protein [Bacillota bacterium]